MISIITSLYKSEKYLAQYAWAIASFLDDATKLGVSVEVLILPNDPTLEELAVLTELSAMSRVRIVPVVKREPLYATWNRGVELASGEVVGFWQCDDVRFVPALIDAEQHFRNGDSLVYFPFLYKRYVRICNLRLLIKRYVVRPPAFNRQTFVSGMHIGPFFLFTKELYKEVGPFDEQFLICGDFDWATRAARLTDFTLSQEVAGVFSKDGGGLSGSGNPRQHAEDNIVYKRQGIAKKVLSGYEALEREYDIATIVSAKK